MSTADLQGLRRSSPAALLGWIASVIVLLGVAVFGIRARGPDVADIPFDSALWLNPPTPTTRLAMLNDLVKSGRLTGRTDAEVRALLGPPRNSVNTPDAPGDYTLWYSPGARRAGNWFNTFLEVRIDGASGRVKDTAETVD